MTEETILSTLLKGTDQQIQDEICNVLKPEHFSDPENAKIYEAILYFHEKGVLVHWTLLIDRLRDLKFECRDGNVNRLTELEDLTAVTVDYKYQIEKMLEVVQRRNLDNLMQKTRLSLRSALPIEETIQDVIEGLERIQQARPKKLQSIADDVREERALPDQARLFETTIFDLDRNYTIHPGHFICIGGEPGMGKTSLALNLMASVYQRGLRGLFISLEMARRDVIERLSAIVRQEPVYQQGKEKWDPLEKFENCFADYGNAYTLQEITKLSYETRPDVIFIDNNLLLHSGKKTSNVTEECKAISRQIKRLCMTQKVVVFLICHVNREDGKKTGKPLTCARLYGSQAWEQDADMVLLLYPEHPEDKSEMVLRIGKNRFGSLRDIPIDFHESQCRFSGKKFETKMDQVLD